MSKGSTVSKGRRVDLFAFLLFGYRYPAAPQDLREGWLLRIEVDGPVDRDRLVDAVERVLRPNQFILDETWSHHSAGEDRSTLEIGIGVPSGVGAGIIDQLVLVVQSHVGSPHPSRGPIPVEEATSDARRMLAQGRGVSTDSILVEEVREQPSGVRLILRGPADERYAVDVDGKDHLYRLTRLGWANGSPDPDGVEVRRGERGSAPRRLLLVLMLPDFGRVDRIGESWGLIDCEEDRTLRAVLVEMLREADH